MNAKDKEMTAITIAAGVRSLWEQGLLLDYNIQAERHQFPVHKVILASVSDFFRVMLTGSLLESQEDSVDLKGVTAVAVRNLIDYIYTGQMNLTEDNVIEVLAGAVHLQITSAIKVCERFLVEHLDVENCLDVLTVFKTYSLQEAAKETKVFIKGNSQRMTGDGQIDALSYDDLHLVIEDWPRSEWDLFLWIKQWVSVDYDERKQYVNELMENNVRFQVMTPAGLEYVQNNDLYTNCEGQWKNCVDQALSYHKLPVHKKVVSDSNESTIRSAESVVAFSIDVDGQYTSSDFFTLQDSWCWRKLPSMTHTSLQASVLTVNNFLIVCGGCDPSNLLQTSSKCHIYDPRTSTWGQLASMIQPRKSFPLVFHGRHELYAIGGCPGYRSNNEARVTRTIELYDFRVNKWTAIVDLPAAVRKHSACCYQDSIYVSGGIPEGETTDFGLSKNLDCFDLKTRTWHRKTSMLSSRFDHLMCVMSHLDQEVIFVIGLNLDLEYYTPQTDQWTKYLLYVYRDLPAYATMLAHENTIYFIAGRALYSSDSEDSDSDASAQFHENICVKLTLSDDGENNLESLPDFPVQDGIPLCAMLAISTEAMDESTIIRPRTGRRR